MLDIKKSTLLLILLYSFVFFGLLSIYLGKDNNYDLRNYHYYQVFAFFHDRLNFDYLPCQHGTFHNPVINFPAYFLIRNTPPIVAGFILGGIHSLNFWLLFILSLIIFPQIFPAASTMVKLLFSLLNAAAGVCGAAFFPEIGTTLNDNFISLFVLAALLLIIKKIINDRPASNLRRKGYFTLSGLCLGMGIGLKLTVVIYGFGFFFAMFSLAPSWKDKIQAAGFWSAGAVAGILLTSGIWMFKLWETYGNPVFPYYNQIFHSPYYAPASFVDERFLPRDGLQTIFYPYYFCASNSYVTEHPFRDIRLAVIYTLLLVLLLGYKFYFKNRSQERLGQADTKFKVLKFLLIFYVISYVTWQCKFSIYRYLIVLDLLAPLLIFLLLEYIFKHYKTVLLATFTTYVCILMTVQVPDWGRLRWGSNFFDVEVPQLALLENALVIVTQPKAWSYLFPYFPASARFVRLNTALTRPGDDNQLQAEMRTLIATHDGPLYLFSNEIYELEDQEILARYGLQFTTNESLVIKSKHELPGLRLCKLQKLTAAGSN